MLELEIGATADGGWYIEASGDLLKEVWITDAIQVGKAAALHARPSPGSGGQMGGEVRLQAAAEEAPP
jgi:hypothetical protein